MYEQFVARVRTQHLRTFNEFCGKADMCGKQYLLDLTAGGYPVIPTADSLDSIAMLPETDRYVVKPKNGADSIGLAFLTHPQLLDRDFSKGDLLIQPAVNFRYEVSFYFINDQFQYALYAPDKEHRWKLEAYQPSNEDIEFAQGFIRWNAIRHGI
ncbi:MAG: hypothetical protein IJ236_01500, partial [Oscillospiraceae bacterium]|nr:hypothetical protein [Oscillospiraceae bacterium]